MSTIANTKVEHNYNRYNGYFFGCLHLINYMYICYAEAPQSMWF